MSESKYIEKKGYRSRYTQERVWRPRPEESRATATPAEQAEWLRTLKEDLPKFIPFLTARCGLDFRGRILEIGAGGAWLSAELSKLPPVVEITTTDLSPRLLQEEAPKVFKLLKANTAKITRTPADFHCLDYPDNYFDFVVCSAGLQQAVNVVQVLREAKRVLKPGGRFVAIREPVWPLMKLKSRARQLERQGGQGAAERYYSRSQYEEFFRQASLPLEVKRVILSSGFRYFVDQVVNGLTHARYAFVGTKRGPAPHPKASALHRRRIASLR